MSHSLTGGGERERERTKNLPLRKLCGSLEQTDEIRRRQYCDIVVERRAEADVDGLR